MKINLRLLDENGCLLQQIRDYQPRFGVLTRTDCPFGLGAEMVSFVAEPYSDTLTVVYRAEKVKSA